MLGALVSVGALVVLALVPSGPARAQTFVSPTPPVGTVVPLPNGSSSVVAAGDRVLSTPIQCPPTCPSGVPAGTAARIVNASNRIEFENATTFLVPLSAVFGGAMTTATGPQPTTGQGQAALTSSPTRSELESGQDLFARIFMSGPAFAAAFFLAEDSRPPDKPPEPPKGPEAKQVQDSVDQMDANNAPVESVLQDLGRVFLPS